ncbi:hypothetical protein MK489_24785 [Myxococcota bacterium]|nr:hypothetical protein [Myxococcota bacterium]
MTKHIERTNEPSTESQLLELEKRGLFVLGSARSGTTILTDCLNLSKEIYLLNEADLWESHSRRGFREHINKKHSGMKNVYTKGNWLPRLLRPEGDGLSFLLELAKRHRYVGEKVAFSPRTQYAKPTPQERFFEFFGPQNQSSRATRQERFFEFQSGTFYASTYLMTIRDPVENAVSMHRMFQDLTLGDCLQVWLHTTSLILDMYLSFSRVHVIFHDRFSAETFSRICEILGVDIPIPAQQISDQHRHTNLSKESIPEELEPLRERFERARAIYQRLESWFSPDTLKCTLSNYWQPSFLALKQDINSLI